MNLDLMEFILELICLKIKDGAYVINLDEYADVCTHWIALLVKIIEIIYFDSVGVKQGPKEIKKFIGHKRKRI